MGTSKSFSDTNHSMVPNWGTLSSALTSNCDSSTVATPKLNNILKQYVKALGGATSAGGGNSNIGGKAGIRTAKKIGGIFSTFTSSGNNIRDTLESTGLTDINNRTVRDVINHLIEYCSGTASKIDDNAAKEASKLLFEDLLAGANNIDEVESLLTETFQTNTSEEIIVKYFGIYINEMLSKWFYENLIRNRKENDCKNLFRQIKDFIFVKLSGMQKTNPLQNINWSSNAADSIIKKIQQDVLTVFE